MEKPKYPIRGWLQGLVEGSATLNETNEAIQGFITHAEDRGWKEGFNVGNRSEWDKHSISLPKS